MPQVFDKDLARTWQAPSVSTGMSGAPTAANDVTQGYQVGDIWVSTVPTSYLCKVNTAGAAVWLTLG